MSRPIIDERTLAGFLIGPTAQRARELELASHPPLILHADVEEHVRDPDSGTTLRCDLTLRSATRALISIEMKRPEVMSATAPVLVADAYRKAVHRGMPLFLTCNFREVALWETAQGANQATPALLHPLVADLSHSSFAQARRDEVAASWRDFLDLLEPRLDVLTSGRKGAQMLPPQAVELRDAIQEASAEASSRIREAVRSDASFRQRVLAEFRDQFGVELHLDPAGPKDVYISEAEQVALISGFVVSMRLLLYCALSKAVRQDGTGFDLDPLEISRTASDPRRVAREIAALLEHARERTGDFETTLTPNTLDDILFVSSTSGSPVGEAWGKVIDTIAAADWSGPAAYVPGLYESLLDDEHRHVMGVHYTPDALAELVVAYAVRDGADTVMDPASGAGTFVTMAYERKRALGSTHDQALAETYGVEIADFAASLATIGLTLADPKAKSAYPRVIKSDFFHTEAGLGTALRLPDVGTVSLPRDLDAIVGNPPYVRFENRTATERAEVFNLLAKRVGEEGMAYPDFTGKADLWAFFIAHAHSFLREDGRLAFVLPLSLLSTTYGDAVLSFLGRYFLVDAIVDSKVERWFAAKQNTLLLLCRRAELPPSRSTQPNPAVPESHVVRFVRLKQPLDMLLSGDLPRGKQAEDLMDDLLDVNHDVADDVRWDVRVVPQIELVRRTSDDVSMEDWNEQD